MDILQYITLSDLPYDHAERCGVRIWQDRGEPGWLDELRRKEHTVLVMRSLLNHKALSFGPWRETINGQTRHLGEHGTIPGGGGSFTDQAEWGLLSEFFNYIVTDDKDSDKLIDVLEYCALFSREEDYWAACETKYGRYLTAFQHGEVERYKPTKRGGSLKEYMDKFRANTNLHFYVTGQFLFEARSFCGGREEELGISEEEINQLSAWESKYVKDYKTLRVAPCGKIRPMTSSEVDKDVWGANQTSIPALRIISSLRLASACHSRGMEKPITINPSTGSYVVPSVERSDEGVSLAPLPRCYLYALGYQVDENKVTLATPKGSYDVTCSYGEEQIRRDMFGDNVVSGHVEFGKKNDNDEEQMDYKLMPSKNPGLNNADFN